MTNQELENEVKKFYPSYHVAVVYSGQLKGVNPTNHHFCGNIFATNVELVTQPKHDLGSVVASLNISELECGVVVQDNANTSLPKSKLQKLYQLANQYSNTPLDERNRQSDNQYTITGNHYVYDKTFNEK